MAVTVNRFRAAVVGDRRWNLMNINIGATGQSLTTPLHQCESEIADANSNVAVEAGVPAAGGPGPITFNYTGGGAQNNVDLLLIGR